ncbi:MAG: S-layer homology domain-containing protein [Armatimonadota bacterium]|nr:S-layer homology domain-containing protein [Armatimonadota bacterium]MDR7407756.1 S-layer homology domain-containing protein [Armatimonadota bacterium]MDR7411212.1 S-layer homology domain-containing protein [Armatimonadota bacterium]MDR7424083.1 S-layer homology domain-containing protein [Armatimonadota bacterium]
MKTRKLALSLASVLVVALVAPVVGQPFADVPTNHWAYDAIAELAAKGLVEGYPDGTFKGNQPLTRYEMAMVVARIIARIEAIPTPPPPEVRRADLDAVRRDLTAATGRIAASERTIATLQRLVNEFRAELQALGVRVTALEEELSALRARLDNTRIAGDFIWWANTLSGARQTPFQQELLRIRLTYTGRMAEGLVGSLRARHFATATSAATVDFDRLWIEWSNALGIEGLTLRAGRHTVNLGPVGLLLHQDTNNQRRDGVLLRWTLGPVGLQASAQWRELARNPDDVLLAARLSLPILPGWVVGVNVRSDTSPDGSGRPRGTGFSGDVSVALLPGINVAAEYAAFDTAGLGTRNWWQAQLEINFAQLAGTEIALNPRLTLWYRDFDSTSGTPLGVVTGSNVLKDAWWGDFVGELVSGRRGPGAMFTVQLLENLSGKLTYENYESKTGGPTLVVWSGTLTWNLAPRTVLNVYYANRDEGGSTTSAAGLYVTTSW